MTSALKGQFQVLCRDPQQGSRAGAGGLIKRLLQPSRWEMVVACTGRAAVGEGEERGFRM